MKQTKALIKAELQAKKEWEERNANIQYNTKKLLIDLLKKIDPLELAAVGALTVVIQPIIATATEVVDAIATIIARAGELAKIYLDVWRWFGLITGQEVPPTVTTSTQAMHWFIAFVVAFIMVRHPEAVMGAAVGGVTTIVKMVTGLLL